MSGRRNFWVRTIPPPDEPGPTGWTISPLVRDYAGHMGSLSLYHSILATGRIPHEVHQHPQEEIEILLSGELELIRPGRTTRIKPGGFHYQAPDSPHTIQAVGREPSHFLVLQWSCLVPRSADSIPEHLVYDPARLLPWVKRPGIQRQQLCSPLDLTNGSQLHIYAAHWPEDTGYQVHTDPFDVLIVLLRGRLSGLGHDTRAPAVIFYPAGMPHGVFPTDGGPLLALYFQFYPPVFEVDSETGNSPTPGGLV
jgi:mannose-6-phosphate isomerase-like protein (cupin superfamily)